MNQRKIPTFMLIYLLGACNSAKILGTQKKRKAKQNYLDV